MQNWKKLLSFYAFSNRLTGSLQESIVENWQNLQYFATGARQIPNYNHFTGSLPEAIGLWSNLLLFVVHNSSFTGTIPESIHTWTALTGFDCSMNPIGGTIPESIGSGWPNLDSFRVWSTELSGKIPESLSSWNKLRVAEFNDTNLEGTVPSGMCDAEGLEILAADCTSEIECSCCTACF